MTCSSRFPDVRLGALLALAACGTPEPVVDAGVVTPTFIALARDFDGYETWERFDLGHQVANTVHNAGDRSVFLKARPPKGSTTWPIGTLFVKVVHADADAGTTDQVFAMAKRGAPFNPSASGWEWFQLDAVADPRVMIWRGDQPPSKAGYLGGPAGACNECHVQGANDHVLTRAAFLDDL